MTIVVVVFITYQVYGLKEFQFYTSQHFKHEGGGLGMGKAVKQTVWVGTGSNVQETDL